MERANEKKSVMAFNSSSAPRMVVVTESGSVPACSPSGSGQTGLRAWVAARLALLVLFCCGIGFSVQRLMFKKLMVEGVSSPFQVVASRGFVAVCVSGAVFLLLLLLSLTHSHFLQSFISRCVDLNHDS